MPAAPARTPRALDLEVVALVSHDGAFTADPRFPLDVDAVDARGLYRLMALARGLNAQALALQRQGQLGLHLPAAAKRRRRGETRWCESGVPRGWG